MTAYFRSTINYKKLFLKVKLRRANYKHGITEKTLANAELLTKSDYILNRLNVLQIKSLKC